MLFPKYGRGVPASARPVRPQVQEQMTAMDRDRLGSFGFHEMGMFELRTGRATPGQFFLRGAPVENVEYLEIPAVEPTFEESI